MTHQNPGRRFNLVSKELPEPPYDKHTSAKGYGFDLDVSRMQNSDSWAICPPEIRPWMMMSWVMSWAQHPCGSLPGDDEIVAVRLGCSLEFLQVHRRFILRGWSLHSDGRLYHPVITEEVCKMIQSREKWKIKKSGQRAVSEKQSLNENVPRESPGSPQSVPGVSPPSLSLSPSLSQQEEEEANASSSKPAAPVIDLFGGEAEKKPAIPQCPHRAIVDLYHEILPELPGITFSLWQNSKDAQSLAMIWKSDKRHRDLNFWRDFFQAVRTNPHWMGENTKWKANLRWLVAKSHFIAGVELMVNHKQQDKAHG